MANTFSQIYIQLVFAVSRRECLISRDHKEELHKYISGIVRNERQKLIAINAMPDHLHALIGLKPDMSISGLVNTMKTGSTKFINAKGWLRGRFSWQEGFGAFSYSHSHVSRVARYVANQEAHHAETSFKDEYLNLLRKFEIAFDEKYLFNWID